MLDIATATGYKLGDRWHGFEPNRLLHETVFEPLFSLRLHGDEMSRASIRACLCGAVIALFLASASSQTRLVSAIDDEPGKLVARLSVDAADAPQAGDFALQLDNSFALAATRIASVPAAPRSAALLICLDRSGSMGAAAIAAMQDVLARTLVPRAGETQLPLEVAIIAFGTRSMHLLSLTSDPTLIAQAVARLSVEREREGRTRLRDAVAGAAAELRSSEASWKRVLVVSDGNDDGSTLSQSMLIQRLQAAPAITVDAIGFGGLAAASSGSLSTLAGATGGRFAIAGTRTDLAAVLGQMIRQSVPKPVFDVSFSYAPATDGRTAEAPMVVYRLKGGEALSMPLGRAVVTAAALSLARGASSVPPLVHADTGGAVGSAAVGDTPIRWWFGLTVVPTLIMRLPMAVWIVLAVLLLAAIAWFALRRDRRDVVEPPPPEPTGFGLPPLQDEPTIRPSYEPYARSSEVAHESALSQWAPPPEAGGERRTVIAHRWPLPGAGKVVAVLIMLDGAASGRKFRIVAARTPIGAGPDNGLVIDGDTYVSGRHALLRAESNALYVTDLDSRNGSELNGATFKNATRSLSPGDRVTFGRTSFEVDTANAAEGASPSGYEPRTE